MLRPIVCFAVAVCSMTFLPAYADHHGNHHAHGPHGGTIVILGQGDLHVELSVQSGELVTARILDKKMKPTAIDAASITFTFTEPDGEKEDYKISVANTDETGSVFQRKSDHVVHHVVRDKMSIKVTAGGKELLSETFAYPHGPNGGELIPLGESKYIAELLVQGDVVSVHLLNERKRPARVGSESITLTFTERDGEEEDYEIPVSEKKGKGTSFVLDDDHVVKHIKRDQTTIKLSAGGEMMASKSFKYASK